MTLTADQQTELEKPVTRFAYFVELHFASGVAYLSTLGGPVTWGNHEWLGLGTLGNISAVEEAKGTAASALNFQLNIANIEWLSISASDVMEYRGRDAKMYFCPLDEQFRLIDTPVVCWRGTMDTMTTSIEQGQPATGKIILKCETSAYGLKRKSVLRLNAAQQKQRHPNDTGFDYLTDLIGNPTGNVWLTVRFQQK